MCFSWTICLLIILKVTIFIYIIYITKVLLSYFCFMIQTFIEPKRGCVWLVSIAKLWFMYSYRSIFCTLCNFVFVLNWTILAFLIGKTFFEVCLSFILGLIQLWSELIPHKQDVGGAEPHRQRFKEPFVSAHYFVLQKRSSCATLCSKGFFGLET